MGVRDQRIGGLGIGVDQVGAQMSDLAKKVNALTAAASEASFVQIDLPEIDTSFAPIFTPHDWGWDVTLRVFIPGSTYALILHLVNEDEVVDEDTYYSFIKEKTKSITDTDRAAQAVEVRFDSVPLESDTTFHVIDIIARDAQGNNHQNPEGGPDYSGYPGNVLYTFTTPSLANAPSDPSAARIIANTLLTTEDGLIPIVTVRVFADEGETLTFAEQRTHAIQCKFEDVDDPDKTPRRNVTIEDDSVTFIDIEVGDLFVLGRQYSWLHNLAWSADENAEATPASPVTFFAGGFADPSDLSGLTLVSFDSEATDSPGTLQITVTLNQPDPPYRLKNYTAKCKISSKPDSEYDLPKNLVVGRESLQDPIYNVPGDIEIKFPITLSPSKIYKIKITVRVVGGFSKDFESGDIDGGGTFLLAATTTNSAGKSLVDGGALLASRANFGVVGEVDYPGRQWETGANSGTKINRLATGVGGATIDSKGLQWRDTEGRLKLNTDIFTKGGKPAIKIGKLFQANDIVSVCALWKADTADESQDIEIAIVDQGGPTDIATAPILAADLTISHTDETNFFCVMQIDPAYVLTDKQWIEFRVSQNPAHPIYLRNIQVHYGAMWSRFQPNDDEKAAIDASSAGGSTASVVYDAGTGVSDAEGRQYIIGGIVGGNITL